MGWLDDLAQSAEDAMNNVGDRLKSIGLTPPANLPVAEKNKPTDKEVVALTMAHDPAAKKAFEDIAATINKNLPDLPQKVTPEMVALTIRNERTHPDEPKGQLNEIVHLAAKELSVDTKMGIGINIGQQINPIDMLNNRLGKEAVLETERRKKHENGVSAAPIPVEQSPLVMQGTGRLTASLLNPETSVTPIDPTSGQVQPAVTAAQLTQAPAMPVTTPAPTTGPQNTIPQMSAPSLAM